MHSQAGGSLACGSTLQDVEFDGGSPVVGYEVEMQPKCKAAKRGMSDDWVLVFQVRKRGSSWAIDILFHWLVGLEVGRAGWAVPAGRLAAQQQEREQRQQWGI